MPLRATAWQNESRKQLFCTFNLIVNYLQFESVATFTSITCYQSRFERERQNNLDTDHYFLNPDWHLFDILIAPLLQQSKLSGTEIGINKCVEILRCILAHAKSIKSCLRSSESYFSILNTVRNPSFWRKGLVRSRNGGHLIEI